MLGYNLYAYTSNNPIMFSDSTGMWKQVSGGWQAQRGDTLWGLSTMLTGNGANWTSLGYSGDPRKLQIGTVIGSSSKGSYSGGKSSVRDVTLSINIALAPYALYSRILKAYPNYSYSTFYSWINHGGVWDIKLADKWRETIGTNFPGKGNQVMYNGVLMTPEQLGNFTYGYLGAAMGFSLNTLLMGSFYAAGHYSMTPHELYGEWQDQSYIRQGYFGH